MVALKFSSSHNIVAFLDKPTESDGFEQIVYFLNAHPIKYALTVNPTIYTSCIEQFWTTAKVKTVNREVQIQSLVDKKKVIITETSIGSDLQFEDAEAFFSPQWKFLIRTIMQCLSAKTTAWNEFSSTMALDRSSVVLDEQEVKVEKVVSTAKVTTASAITTTVDELTLDIIFLIDEEIAQRLQEELQAELEEEEMLARQKEEDANIIEWDNVQAMMDADYELAARLQTHEQEELTIE
ncbi:hypothetical protein Tco_1056561 [Tanacetum coccineum]|uniref:Xylulose kinase-1 n=1 Tax=Tanacetum coccineum TaxID=301880 RepID=A0ABQ5H3N6_9ASTR